MVQESAEVLPGRDHASMISGIVDSIDEMTGGNSARFAAELEFSLLNEVDKRARSAMRAEKSGVVEEGRGHSLFARSIDSTNRRIAEIRSRLDGKSVEEHLHNIREQDRKPKKGFFESLIEDQNNKIAMIKAKIAEREGKKPDAKARAASSLSPRERDDLQKAREKAKSKKTTINQEVQRTRDEIRLTALKLQAYRSLSKILKGHISKIEEEISSGKELDQKKIDKLNKFKDAAEKFSRKIDVLSKKKDGLDAKQKENLKRQKIARFKELEEKMKAKRKELASARRAQRAAADDQNYASFILPGDFMKIVKQEQEQAAESRASEIASDVESLAEAIKESGSSKDAGVSTARSAAVTVAEEAKSDVARGSNSISVDTKPPGVEDPVERKADNIGMALFGDGVNASTHEMDKPAATPVTKEVLERKQKQADFDPGFYRKKSKK